MKRSPLTLALFLVLPLILTSTIACASQTLTDIPTPATSNPSSAPTTAATTWTAAESAATQKSSGKINVVTTTNLVADWVEQVGGDRVGIFSLVPINTDPHTFQPGAQDIRNIADADLVLSIGLSLEAGWMSQLLENAARSPNIIVAIGDYVDPIRFMEVFQEHKEEHEEHGAREGEEELEGREIHEGPDHGELDPHFWLDPQRVKEAVNAIADQLSTLDPDGAGFYRDNAAAYNRELDTLHAWIQREVAQLPEQRRLLVTSHDSFRYFAHRYGFKVVDTIMPVTTEAEPTAQELANLIEAIQHEGAPAVFAEKQHSKRLARRLAEETGAKLVGGLYTGSLGAAGGEAGTYLGLMRYNVETIVEALR